jgi:peptide/nickel transport system substrate-binding protein
MPNADGKTSGYGTDDTTGINNRRHFLQMGAATGALALLAPLIEACGGPSSSSQTSSAVKGSGGSVLVATLAETFTKFDPRTNADIAGIVVTDLVFEGITRRDPASGQVTNQLANSMPEMINDKTCRVTIRPGAKFQDGTPVTPADVIYTLKTMQSPSLGSLYQPYLSIFADARAVGDNVVEFDLAFPTSLVNDRLTFLRVVPKALIESKGVNAFAVHPVGSGPYQFVSAIANDKITLQRSPTYNGKIANSTPRIELLQQTNPSAAVNSLLTGQTAVMDGVPFNDLATLGRNSSIKTASVPGHLEALVLFNCVKPPLNDVRVRQAFLYAINREQIVKGVYLGNATVANSVFAPSDSAYVRPSTVYDYNPDKAKALLSAAGHSSGFDLELMVANQGIMTSVAPIIQSNLNAVGIKTTIKTGDTEALYTYVTNGSYQAYFAPADWAVFGLDPDLMLSWLYQGSFAKEYLYWTTPEAKEFSGVLDAALRESNPSSAQTGWAKAQNIIADNVPAFPLFLLNEASAYWKDIEDFTPGSDAGLNMVGVTAGSWKPRG